MTDKLKPCPFCEGEAIIHSYGFNQYSVGCSECWVETNRTAGVESAVKQWNTRKPMDRIVKQLETEFELVVTQFPLHGRYIKKSRAIAIVKGCDSDDR